MVTQAGFCGKLWRIAYAVANPSPLFVPLPLLIFRFFALEAVLHVSVSCSGNSSATAGFAVD
ncbi:MAG TPA: hypothetical protein DIT89_10355 [Planctomycetaceae bacterium]|nr:hypothetical protein [Planctomycetaceae bacterium]